MRASEIIENAKLNIKNGLNLIRMMEKEIEIWEVLDGVFDNYAVSTFGNIKNITVFIPVQLPSTKVIGTYYTYLSSTGREENIYDNGKYLNPQIGKNGNRCVVLSKVDHSLANPYIHQSFKLHQLIAKTFIKNPENKECVRHINGRGGDNNVSNLQWISRKELSDEIRRTYTRRI